MLPLIVSYFSHTFIFIFHYFCGADAVFIRKLLLWTCMLCTVMVCVYGFAIVNMGLGGIQARDC